MGSVRMLSHAHTCYCMLSSQQPSTDPFPALADSLSCALDFKGGTLGTSKDLHVSVSWGMHLIEAWGMLT